MGVVLQSDCLASSTRSGGARISRKSCCAEAAADMWDADNNSEGPAVAGRGRWVRAGLAGLLQVLGQACSTKPSAARMAIAGPAM